MTNNANNPYDKCIRCGGTRSFNERMPNGKCFTMLYDIIENRHAYKKHQAADRRVKKEDCSS